MANHLHNQEKASQKRLHYLLSENSKAHMKRFKNCDSVHGVQCQESAMGNNRCLKAEAASVSSKSSACYASVMSSLGFQMVKNPFRWARSPHRPWALTIDLDKAFIWKMMACIVVSVILWDEKHTGVRLGGEEGRGGAWVHLCLIEWAMGFNSTWLRFISRISALEVTIRIPSDSFQ